MKSIALFLVIVKTAAGTKDTDEIDDEKLPALLWDMGERLAKELTTPKYTNGTDLMEDLFDYYSNLDDIQELIDNCDEDRVEKGKELYEIMLAKGGPQILNIRIDYDKLVSKYNWVTGGKDVRYARQVVQDISDLWIMIGHKARGDITTTTTTKRTTTESMMTDYWDYMNYLNETGLIDEFPSEGF